MKGPLEDDRRGRGRQGSGGQTGTGGSAGKLERMLRIARGTPQAVVKITSYGHGRRAAMDSLMYISRKEELEIETDQGLGLEGKGSAERLVDQWAPTFSRRRDGRDVMNLTLSFPPGADKHAAQGAARECLRECFSENHHYGFAAHDDTDHFHVHAVIKMRGHDGKQLATAKKDLRRWRSVLAHEARARGIELDDSPRYARGKGRRGTSRAVQQIKARGERPRVEQELARAAIERATNPAAKPHEAEVRMEATNGRERVEYARRAALTAHAAAELGDEAQQAKGLKVAAELASYALRMPVPRTRGAGDGRSAAQGTRAGQGARSGGGTPVSGASRITTGRASKRVRRSKAWAADPSAARGVDPSTGSATSSSGSRT